LAKVDCVVIKNTPQSRKNLDADLVVQSLRALEVERIRELVATPEND